MPAAWPTSARWRKTRRAPPTSSATPKSCATAASCANWPKWARRLPTAPTIRSAVNAGQLLDEAESKVFEIAEANARGKQGFVEIQPLLIQVVERIDELFQRDNPDEVTGIPTGFHDLDQKTSGLQPGDLIIVAGRPSMGKTAFSINIGENVALNTGLPVAIFSMEMGGAQLAMRMIGSVGKLDQQKIRTGRLQDEDWLRLTNAVGKLNDAPIHIDESAALTALELRARARRLHRQCGKLGLIIIDYLQLMSGSGGGRKPRHGNLRNLALAQSAGERTGSAGDCALPAQPQPRTAPQQAAGHVRSA